MQTPIDHTNQKPHIFKWQISALFGVRLSTLCDRLNGTQSHRLSAQHLQQIQPAEEVVLVGWINKSLFWGWPPRIPHLREMTTEFLISRADTRLFSKKWHHHSL